jgi:hypothetical protein
MTGEAKRKRSIQALQDRLEDIHAEGQGVWQISIYGLDAVVEVMAAALAGSKTATGIALALEHLSQGVIRSGRTAEPVMCLLCDSAFKQERMPAAWILVHARRDDPTHAAGHGVCSNCLHRYPDMNALGIAITDYYRANAISDLRLLPPISEPGGIA